MSTSGAQSTVTPLTLEDESFIVMGRDVIDVFGLECDVCKDLFDRQAKLPKLLPCRHTVCRACLDKMVETKRIEMGSSLAIVMYCPQCKKQVNSDAIQSLPNDHRVMKGLDIIGKAKATFKNVCFKHDCQKLDRFCEKCEVPVCQDCVSLLHTKAKTNDNAQPAGGFSFGLSSASVPVFGVAANDHAITDLSNALKKMDTQLDDLERQCTASLGQKKVKYDVIRNIKHRSEKNENDQIKKIEERFDHYSKILLERKEALINMIKDMAKKDISDINLEIRTCEESTNELQRLYNRFTSSRESEDVRQMFKLRKQIIGNDLLKVSSSESLCKTIEFQAVNGDRFKSDLGTLGNLATKIDLKLQCPESESGSQISQAPFQFSAP